MKRNFAAALISMALLGCASRCGKEADIGKDKAAEIALTDAGFSEAEVTRLRVSQDRDDGQSIYEVEFTCGTTEYDYEILASDGDILSADYEGSAAQSDRQDPNGQQAQSGQEQTGQQNPNGQQGQQNTGSHGHSVNNQNAQADVAVSTEQASQLALDRVPGASAQDLKIELDYDDGYYKYEGDIIYDQKEYEFEIDANTGDFLEWKEERR